MFKERQAYGDNPLADVLGRLRRRVSGFRRRRELRKAEREAMTMFNVLGRAALDAGDFARVKADAELAAERRWHHDTALRAYKAMKHARWLNTRAEFYIAAAIACSKGREPPPASDLERDMGWRWS